MATKKTKAHMNRAMVLEKVVISYIRDYRPLAKKEDRHFKRLLSLKEAVSQAALCLDPRGKRHPHQCRIPRTSLEDVKYILLNLDLASADFQQLHDTVSSAIRHIHMIGPLAIYDISQRIGTYLGIQPNVIYLHRGTKQGAAALGLSSRTGVLNVEDLPEQFQRLSPDEIEDCLCIYKHQLTQVESASKEKQQGRANACSCLLR